MKIGRSSNRFPVNYNTETEGLEYQDNGAQPINIGSGSASYLVYTALLSQSGTDAPVATVLENTLGGTVVWGRPNVGEYTATLAAAFTENKTAVFITYDLTQSVGGLVLGGGRSSSDTVHVYNYLGDYSLVDGFFCSIEIRVYPA